MIKKLILVLFIILYSKTTLSTNIAVLDIEKLLDSNKYYQEFLLKIENNQKINSNIIKENEIKLNKMQSEIDKSKLVLNETEINNLIKNYNIELDKFTNLVDSFNMHYQDEIIKMRKLILQEIIVLTEKYAKNNNIELILDSTNYLIASNNINITEIIKKMLIDIELKLEFKDFENN